MNSNVAGDAALIDCLKSFARFGRGIRQNSITDVLPQTKLTNPDDNDTITLTDVYPAYWDESFSATPDCSMLAIDPCSSEGEGGQIVLEKALRMSEVTVA
jgi:hypothetical protein